MAGKKRRLCFWADDKDRERLELIRSVFGISISAAMRVSVRAASEKLGLEKETPTEHLQKK